MFNQTQYTRKSGDLPIGSIQTGGSVVHRSKDPRLDANTLALARALGVNVESKRVSPSTDAAPEKIGTVSSCSATKFSPKKEHKVPFDKLSFPEGISGRIENNQFIIQIDLEASVFLNTEIKEAVQALLKTRRGYRSDWCVEDSVVRTDDGLVEKLGFCKPKPAALLVDMLKKIIPCDLTASNSYS